MRIDLPARFINHSCDASNMGTVDNEFGAYDFLAVKMFEEEGGREGGEKWRFLIMI